MIRKIFLSLLGLVIAVVVVFGAAFAYAQSRMAKDQLSGIIETQISSEEQTADVEELGGFLPFDVQIGRFSLADDEGVWLEVNAARLKMSPSRLLAGELFVEELGAERVVVERLPPPGPEVAVEEPADGAPFQLPEPPQLPEALPVFAAERLYVNEIRLGEPVLGQAASFRLEGGARTTENGEKLTARLDLERIDQETAQANLSADVDLETGRIGLNLEARESGGLLATATGRPDAGDLELSLGGDGPLSDWQASLALNAENLLRANAELGLAYADQPGLSLDADIVPAEGALPPDIAALIGERLTLALAAGQTAPGAFALERLSLDSALLQATGQGRASLEEDTLNGQIEINAANLGLASGIAGTDLGGSLGLTVNAEGSFNQPRFMVSLNGENVQAATADIAGLESALDLRLHAPLDQGFTGVDVSGGGSVTGIRLADAPLRPEDSLTWNIEASLPMEGEARIGRFGVSGDHLDAVLQATMQMPSMQGQAQVTANVADLQALLAAMGPQAPAGLDLAGATELAADLSFTEQFQTISGDLRLTTSELAGLPANAGSLLGTSPSLRANLEFAQGERVRIGDLRFDAANAALAGELGLGLGETQALSGGLTLELPRMASLEPIIGQPISGAGTLTTSLGGSLAAPDISAEASLVDLAVAGQTLESVGLTATAAGPMDDLAGRVRLTARQHEEDLSLESAYRYTGERVALSEFALRGPTTAITGEVDLGLSPLLASGRLQGGVRDLAALRPWHQQALAGAVTLDAQLTAEAEQQNAEIALGLASIEGDFGRLSGLDVQATLTDVMGRLGIDGAITLREFAQPGLRVQTANVDVGGSLEEISLEATAEGQQEQGPFNVTSAARLDVLGERKRVNLDRLNGLFAGQTIELRNPATLVLEDGVLNLDQLDLKVGTAQIQGNAVMGDETIRAEATIETFPLAMLTRVGATPLEGTASASLLVEGPTTGPRAEFRVNVAGLRIEDPFLEEMPPAAVTLEAGLAEGRLDGRIELARLSDEAVQGRFSLPVRLSLAPFALDLPEGEPLDGSIDGSIELARLVRFAQLDGQVAAGQLETALTLDGTYEAPVVRGSITTNEARIEDSITGLVLRDLALDLEANGQEIVLSRLSASDGNDGRLSASGRLSLDPLREYPFEIRLETGEARVLDNELGRAWVSSDIEIGGDRLGGSIVGDVTVERADLRIPGGGGGVNIASLDVEEIGRDPFLQPFRFGNGNGNGEEGPGYVLGLNVTIDMPARLFVRGRGLESEWGGELEIMGSTAEPEIIGEIRFRRGFMDFLDRRLNIRQGIVRFTGATPPNPEIELEATAQGETIEAVVRLQGSVANPELVLDSEPSVPQDEILAQLLFGRDVSQMTPGQGVRLAAAVSELEGGGVDALGGVRETLGLDSLDVGGESVEEATASAGKYIADNVYLEVEQGLTTGASKARVEIELTPNVTVEAATGGGESAQSSVGVEWRYDY